MLNQKRLNAFYLWFPVLPLLGYWGLAYLLYNFGKYNTPPISIESHIFVLAYLAIFAVSYRYGLRIKKEPHPRCQIMSDRSTQRILGFSSWMLFLGTLIFLYDKLSSGASSPDLVLNELYSIREEHLENTTFLTTLAVVPQSFKSVAISAYFYALWRGIHIPKSIHIVIIATVLLEIANMVLSASRGALFWTLSYVAFYLIYIQRINVFREMFSLNNLLIKALLFVLIIAAYSYFAWVAENRVVSATAEYLGRQAYFQLKNSSRVDSVDYSRLGAEYQIFYYLTHGFEYTDAIIKHAPIINFDIVSPLGIRVESQLRKLSPGYVHPAKVELLAIMEEEGLNTSGWPTIFGASLAYFGIIGSLIFSGVIGYASGYASRKWLSLRSLGWLIIVTLIFSSLNMSFDWIVRDFDQFVALAFGLYLVSTRSRNNM